MNALEIIDRMRNVLRLGEQISPQMILRSSIPANCGEQQPNHE